jgi:hypothetical protein
MARPVIHPTYRYPNGLQEGPPAERGTLWAGPWRRVVLALAVVLLLLLAVVAAWVLSNLNDAPAAPRPAELALPQPRLAPERNAAFVLLGLNAAADRDPGRVGRETWALQMQMAQRVSAAATPAERQALMAATAEQIQALAGTALNPAQGAPWNCDGFTDGCVAAYRDQADALAQQRQGMAVMGARCDALLDSSLPDKALAFEEVLPTVFNLGAAVAVAGHLSAANLCANWFNSGAVLAHRQGRRDEALRLLARSSQWHRTLIAGSHTLVAQMTAHSMARRYLRLLSGLAAQEPALAVQLMPLAGSFGAPEQLARRWVVAEAAFSHGTLQAAGPAAGDEGAAASGKPLWETAAHAMGLQHLLWQRERTLQLMDQQWLGLLKRVDAGLPGALADVPPEAGGVLRWWRNPAGQMMVDLSRGAYVSYLRRQLDLELHREAAVLALNAQRHPCC